MLVNVSSVFLLTWLIVALFLYNLSALGGISLIIFNILIKLRMDYWNRISY